MGGGGGTLHRIAQACSRTQGEGSESVMIIGLTPITIILLLTFLTGCCTAALGEGSMGNRQLEEFRSILLTDIFTHFQATQGSPGRSESMSQL